MIFLLFGGWVIICGEVGYIEVFDVIELFVLICFFVGGDVSVCGFVYEFLGLLDNDGEVIGGCYLLVGSLEYDYLIME